MTVKNSEQFPPLCLNLIECLELGQRCHTKTDRAVQFILYRDYQPGLPPYPTDQTASLFRKTVLDMQSDLRYVLWCQIQI